ncbi:MAG TPA: hypothetical protein VFP67_00720 [Acidimicrobiia bacterium]|nr:hypothetical protein [Acidimicrobiia bacterium]
MTELLLIVHILAAAAWIGGSFLTGFIAPRMARSGSEGAVLGWARVAAEAGVKYFNPAGILTALSGIGLVLTSDIYEWSDAFVSIGLGVVIAAALIGALVHRPGGEKMISALESGDRATAAAEGKRAAIWGAITAVLLIVAVVVMVLKTGAAQ